MIASTSLPVFQATKKLLVVTVLLLGSVPIGSDFEEREVSRAAATAATATTDVFMRQMSFLREIPIEFN
jgi:hypothetical protein